MKKLPNLKEIKIPTMHDIRRWTLDFRRDVIRMMRLKFVAVSMGILIVVFLIMLTSINMIMNTVSESQSMALLKQIAESERYNNVNEMPFDGMPPQKPEDDVPPEFRGMLPPESPLDPTEAETIENVDFAFGGAVMPLKLEQKEKMEDREKNDRWWEDSDYFRPPFEDDWDDDWDDWDDDEWKPPEWDDSQFFRRDPNHEEQTATTEYQNNPPENTPAPESPVSTQAPPPEENPASVQSPEPVVENPAPIEEPAPAENPAPVNAPPPEENPAPANNTPPPENTPVEDVPPPVPAESAPPATTTTLQTSETTTSMTTATEMTSTETLATETTELTTPPPMPNGSDPPPDGVGNGGNVGNNGQFRREMRRDRWNMIVNIDHFAILVDEDGNFVSLRNTEDYTEDEAVEIMKGIIGKNKQQGMYGWLQYYIAQKDYGNVIVVTDKTSDQGLLNNLFRTTVIIGLLMLLILLVILIILSKLITNPVEQAFVRQKQFVSDAGHELKTPLAVMTANADILQDEIGENKWLVYMQEQIGRMSQLVGDLLRLARMDNATQQYTFEDFDLSLAVAATALPFESRAFEEHRNLEIDVQPNVRYNGSEQHIRQLCAIFIDNAIKYSNENGKIKVTLLQRGDHQILEFYNTGCEISPSETEKIFERFYRGDKARNNKGKSGYGLGLAIAKSIMDVHKIRIQVTCEQGSWIRFLMTM